jgi:DNA modification methylase
LSIRILQGDVRERLAELPPNSFDCIVTSPPYWGLRDYGTAKWEGGSGDCDHLEPKNLGASRLRNDGREHVDPYDGEKALSIGRPYLRECRKCGASRIDNQIGLEPTLTEYLDTMVAVCREMRRVLKPSGTFWLNVGDSYAANGISGLADGTLGGRNIKEHSRQKKTVPAGLKPKDLGMVPNRLAIRLQEDGWYVRSEIIWAKPNPMPESVTDRPTSSHEKIWLLTKSERYWYDRDAIAEPAIYSDLANQDASGFKDPRLFNGKHKDGYRTDKQRGHSRRHAGFNERWDAMGKDEQCSGMRNIRNVWTISTRPYSEAHFATFPPELAERCIKAGCPVGGHVLDPFGGAGTTGLVADRLGRHATMIELNPSYVNLIKDRIADDAGMFASVAAE